MSSGRSVFISSPCSHVIMSEQRDERQALQRELTQPEGQPLPNPKLPYLLKYARNGQAVHGTDRGVALVKITYNSSAFPYWTHLCVSCSPFCVTEGCRLLDSCLEKEIQDTLG